LDGDLGQIFFILTKLSQIPFNKKETLNLKAFIIPCDKLDENGLKLVSKGEIAKEIHLKSLLKTDQIEGNRYLFLLSGGYIDNKDVIVKSLSKSSSIMLWMVILGKFSLFSQN
jgi:hypothetical protein